MAVGTTPRTVHIAVLECLRLPDNVAKVRGQFGGVFQTWLETALKTYDAAGPSSLEISFSSWDVEHGQYPPSLDGVDVLIVTGSTASAYDQDPWIERLGAYLIDTYTHHPRVRLFGGCFGHQLLCHALLGAGPSLPASSPQGTNTTNAAAAHVERSPRGWEIGVHDVRLSAEFRAQFPRLRGREAMACQFLHADHVVVGGGGQEGDEKRGQKEKEKGEEEPGLPPGWISVGSSDLCDVQGVLEPGRVLTFQGHPEFDRFLNGEAVRNLGRTGTLSEGETEEALRLIDRDDDAGLHGHVLLDFITGAV